MYFHELPAVERQLPPLLGEPLESAVRLDCRGIRFHVQRVRLIAGARAGVELLIVDSGQVRAAICPTRGMGLWRANIGGVDCGWNSPVHGPIHPRHVPVDEPRGIGWLDGFDELLVRCGLRSFGAPDFDAAGRVLWPVHGRIANIPAEPVLLGIDEERRQLHVSALVHEVRFLQYSLSLEVRYAFTLDQPTIEVHDIVRNSGGTPVSTQLLYHINVGRPILGEGARLHLAAPHIVARDATAAAALADWQEYLPPTAGFSEQVFFSQPTADADGWATTLLADAAGETGFALHYDTRSLPYFSQWKNTVAEADGYVTGLEPGTGFPNPRSFEEQQGRTIELAAGEERHFLLRLEGIAGADRVASLAEKIAAANGVGPKLNEFAADWCLPR